MSSGIRFAEPSDAAAIRAIYAPNVESTVISFEMVPPTVEEMAERIARISAQYPWLVCETDGRLAGYVYACPHRERAAYRWAVDVAVYVDESFQRRSVGRALYRSLLTLLRMQGYTQAFASITLPNPGSVGLHEAVGFAPVAVYRKVGHKLGAWRDVGWWQLELSSDDHAPTEPVPIRTLADSEAVVAALRAAEKGL
jgi:phosphinothricin acetyltransferase